MIAETICLTGDPNAGRQVSLHSNLWTREDGQHRGAIVLVHGLGDHGGRFAAFARRMTDRGWAVFAADLPGHGRSSGRRGTAKNYDAVLSILARSRECVAQRLPGVPQFLVGHSMGGNFAVNYALRRREFDSCLADPLSGLLLVAPMLMPPDFLDRQKIFAAWGTGQLLRWVRISKPARVDQLTRDEAMAAQIESDPLQHDQISLFLATQLLAQGRFALDKAHEIQPPTLVIHGDQDELIDHAACRSLAVRSRGRAQCVRWPGGRHDLVNDIDADRIADELTAWMAERLLQREVWNMIA